MDPLATNDDNSLAMETEHHQQHDDMIKDDHNQQHHLLQLSEMADLVQDLQGDIVAIPKEIILITLVSNEQSLYNPRHEQYRNIQRKDAKWQQIAESVGWTEAQCKNKWKAMRDQYCRELKRFKFNTKANIKWKYFKELEFLRPYALSRHYRPRHPSTQAAAKSTINTNSTNNNNNNNTLSNTSNLSTNSSNTTTPNSSNSNNNNNNNTKNNSSNNQHASTQFNGNCLGHSVSDAISIKIETNQLTGCELTTIKSEPPTRLLNSSLNSDQLESVNWNNYLNVTSATTIATNTQSQHNAMEQHSQAPTTNTTDEALYNAIVNCINSTTIEQQLQQQQQEEEQQQQQSLAQAHNINEHNVSNATLAACNEDEDDPIHFFLNYESYFEKELIALVKQEDILYNIYNLNYRNLKRKKEVWRDIAKKLKKTEKQCRGKWKALRDQYIREHKRLRDRDDIESLPRWKHYDALNFLRKYIRHKSELDAKNLLQLPKSAHLSGDMDDDDDDDGQLISESTLDEMQEQKITPTLLQLQGLPVLSGPHRVQRQQQLHDPLDDTQMAQANANSTSICVTNDYDEMDIDTYIIGDSNQQPHDITGDEDDIDEDDEDADDTQHCNVAEEIEDDEDDVDVGVDIDDEDGEGEDEEEDDDDNDDATTDFVKHADDVDCASLMNEQNLHKSHTHTHTQQQQQQLHHQEQQQQLEQQQQQQQQHFINFKRGNPNILLLQQHHNRQHVPQHVDALLNGVAMGHDDVDIKDNILPPDFDTLKAMNAAVTNSTSTASTQTVNTMRKLNNNATTTTTTAPANSDLTMTAMPTISTPTSTPTLLTTTPPSAATSTIGNSNNLQLNLQTTPPTPTTQRLHEDQKPPQQLLQFNIDTTTANLASIQHHQQQQQEQLRSGYLTNGVGTLSMLHDSGVSTTAAASTTTTESPTQQRMLNCNNNNNNANFATDVMMNSGATGLLTTVATTTTSTTHAAPTTSTAPILNVAQQQQQHPHQQQLQQQQQQQQQQLNNHNNNNNNDDDEVGAFFKAVAMKIRKAKMSPTDFTDLQINILRVINGSLRNF